MMMNGDDDAMHIEYMENKYIYYIGIYSKRWIIMCITGMMMVMMMIKESSIPWVWQWLRDGQDLCHFFSLLNHESSLAPRLLMFVDNSDDNDSREEENDDNNQLQW